MHFINYINRLTATKVDSTYLGCLIMQQQCITYMSVASLERMTTGPVAELLNPSPTEVDKRC